MMEDHLTKIYIPHLAGQFRQATPVLLTGAGFSRGAKNLQGGSIPIPDELCREIWTISFPGEEYEEGSSLQDLFEDARLRHANKLRDRLTELLTVSSQDVPEYYSTIYSMPWSRCYTLNIDDLEGAVSRKFEISRRLRPLSATTSPSPGEESSDNLSLDIVHLNGTLADLPNGVTFSTLQYAERLSRPDPWYIRLIADLLSRPVVFIGTSLNEPPLWQHLELRRQKGGRSERELRPRSYLVTPTLPLSRRALLAEFNTVWLPMTAEEFAKQIIGKLRREAEEGLSYLLSNPSADRRKSHALPLVSKLSVNPLKKTDYLIGQEPDWSDIQSNRAIEREDDYELQTIIDEQLSTKGIRGAIVITGTAGSGKSTTLMRAALRLTALGHKVAWIDRDMDFSPRDITVGMRGDTAPDILAIDDADVYGSELSSLTREIATDESRPLILLEIRSGKLDRTILRSLLQGVPIKELSMRHLTNEDIDALLDVLDRENRLGMLKGIPRVQQVQALKEYAGRQLLVAMYQATSGRKFEDKAHEELFELEDDAQFIYALVSVATTHRFGLSRDEIVIAVGDRSNVTLNVIDRLFRRHLILPSRDGATYRTRHRVIARILTDELQKRGSVKDILQGLILVAATKVQPGMRRSSRPYRMLRVFMNHDLLFRMLDREQARSLYGSMEPLLHWDSHFWLQRGSLEVEEGDLRLAENFLGQAKSLAPDDPYVDNEWAYLLFKKAIDAPGSHDAPDLVEQATEILLGIISSQKGKSEYPYHVLGSQGLAWTRRGMKNDEEKSRYLQKLISAVQAGISLNPDSEYLSQLGQDLRRELLSLSLPSYLRQ